MQFEPNQKVLDTIGGYPSEIQDRVLAIRDLIIEAAKEIEGIDKLEEDLKWGEPSYLTKIGSTVRFGWNESNPDQYAVYFHCQTTLIETFRKVLPDLTYEGNRAIVFHIEDEAPGDELKQCLALALEYHRIKHLPLLGI